MKVSSTILALFLVVIASFAQEPLFTVQPTLVKTGSSQWNVEFALNRFSDVAVSIINISDSTVIRHLAGGMLGSKAPSPLIKDSLHQKLVWDGKNDFGQLVSVPDNVVRVRVRAGMGARLVSMVGGNPYYFFTTPTYSSSIMGHGTMQGIVVGKDGSVYVCGAPGPFRHQHWFGNLYVIRQYDKNGDYVKTVYPFPSNLPIEKARGWGVTEFPDGTYSPKNVNTSMISFGTTIMTPVLAQNYAGCGLRMMDKNGNLVYGSYGSLMAIGVDGSIPVTGGSLKAVTSPALPYWRSLQGNGYMTPIPGTNKVYFSGLYGPDTGFYRDGNVYKLDISTGVAEKWLTLPWDSIPKVKSPREIRLGGGPFFSAIHGTALDSAGRVYVCDRLNQQIGIYDSNAVLLRSIPLPCADQVAISKSGAIYAITRYQVPQNPFSSAGHVRLFKFTSFAEGTVKVCSLTLANNVHSQNCLSMTCLAVNDVNAKPWVWIGSSGITVRAYQDDGNALTLVKDFFAERGNSNVVYDRLLVDKKTENLYVNDSWNGFYKIKDWSNPTLLQCSTSARKPLQGADWAIGNNNLLYVREGVDYMGPVKRYTLDHLHSPANWANTNSNMLTSDIFNRFAPCTGDRGIALTTDNKVAVMQKNRTTADYEVCVYGDSGSAVATAKKVQISKLPQSCGGVQIDTKNNLYVGAVIRSSDFQIPSFYQGDKGYSTGVGSIVKFADGDTGSVGATSAVNASKVYTVPLGPFSADPYPASAPCVCRSPRFEVDPYGRIFAPNAVTNQVTIVDNEGNQLLQFGKYGNLDSRGVLPADLPTQQIVTGTEIPLGWPTTVATSEDYIYVGDLVNCRLVRLKMSYALDNYPGLTEQVAKEQNEASWPSSSYRLTSGPVPFNQSSTILLSLPSATKVRVDVLDVRGKLVKTLDNSDLSSGVHRYSWNGTNLRNQPVSAGLYVYRVTAGNKVLISKTIRSK